MRQSVSLFLPACCCLFLNSPAHAQAPVEDRAAPQKTQSQAQMKAEYARKEKDAAADRLRAAEAELNEATRAQDAAAQRLEEAKRRAMAARSGLETARLNYQNAENRAAQAAAEVGQAWQK